MGSLEGEYQKYLDELEQQRRAGEARERIFSSQPTPGILALCREFVPLVKVKTLPIAQLTTTYPGRAHANPRALIKPSARYGLKVYERTGAEGWVVGLGVAITREGTLIAADKMISQDKNDLYCPPAANWQLHRIHLRRSRVGTEFIGMDSLPQSVLIAFADAHPDHPGKGPVLRRAGIITPLRESLLNFLKFNNTEGPQQPPGRSRRRL